MPTKKTINVEVDEGLTELTEFTPTRVDQVRSPASGAPILMMKSIEKDAAPSETSTGCGCCSKCSSGTSKDVNAVGGINEKPDIDGAEGILQMLARLIESEAREMAAGSFDESSDIQLLSEIASLVQCFRSREMWGDDDDGDMMKDLDDFTKEVEDTFIKAHRKFSADERKRLASEGNALEDGSYPIPDADALRRAAVLARSGHGNVAAAKRLIAKRAKELGVANPLANDNKTSKSTATQADGYGPGADYDPNVKDEDETTDVDESEGGEHEPTPSGDPNGTEVISKAVLAEAMKPLKDELELVKAELAKVLDTPIPGAPAMTAPPAARRAAERDELLAKAANAERMATMIPEQDMKTYYKQIAEQARLDAAALN